MNRSRFEYTLYLRTTPERLWQALTSPEDTRRYWFETVQQSTWAPGGPWQMILPDGRVADSGEIVESVPPRRLVISWRNEFIPALKEEGFSRLSIDIEQPTESVVLRLVHEMELPDSKFIASVAEGWPGILSSLKSLLETGEPLSETMRWPEGL